MQLFLILLAHIYWSLGPRAYSSDVYAVSRRGSIYFEDSDITVSISTSNGDRIAEAFNATTGVIDARKQRWVSLGLPQLLVPKDQVNKTSAKIPAVKFVSGGFYIFIKTLSSEVARELAKEASLKYGVDISISQFIAIDKHIGSVECSLDLFFNETTGFIKLAGSAVIIANPIVVLFKLPSPTNTYIKILINETNPLIFHCNIELYGRSRRPNNFRLSALEDTNSLDGNIRSEIKVNGSRYRLIKSEAQKVSTVFTEQFSLTTDDFLVTEIVNECTAAVERRAIDRLNAAVLNATTSVRDIRDSMNQSLTSINQMSRTFTTRINCAFAMATRGEYMLTMLQGANLSACSDFSIPGGQGFALFTTNSTFTVPPGIYFVRALAVGGGAGGGSGYAGGGGSGYVSINNSLKVTPLAQINVTVGRGGRASNMKMGDIYQNGGGGGRSGFGSLLVADGGVAISSGWNGGNGGSGGGGGFWNGGNTGTSGAGGTDGGNGGSSTYSSGTGQATFSQQLRVFRLNSFAAGSGGVGSSVFSNWGGGGGVGGGVLMNGEGPSGGRGQFGNSFGGNGYGAGGAGGGYFQNIGFGHPHYGGGDGADGLVYIEW